MSVVRRRQSPVLWGISATIIALITVMCGSLWLGQQRRLAAEQVEGPRVQGDLRLVTRHRASTPINPPPAWLQSLYSVIGYQWNRPEIAYSLEIAMSTPVQGVSNGVLVGPRAVLPISDYTAMAITLSGKTFPLEVGLEPSLQFSTAQTAGTGPAPQSKAFYVMLPETVPGSVDYLDVTVTGRGKIATWRVRDLPKLPHQVLPPRQPTATIQTEGVTMQAVAFFQRDIFKMACWMTYMVSPESPQVLSGGPDGIRLTRESDVVDSENPELQVEQVLLEWGNGAASLNDAEVYTRMKRHGEPLTAASHQYESGIKRQGIQAFGGEQKWARIVARLKQYQRITTPVLFKQLSIKQTPKGPRLDLADSRTVRKANGISVTLREPTQGRKKPRNQTRNPLGMSFPHSPSFTTASASGMIVQLDWSLAGSANGKSGAASASGVGKFDMTYFPFPIIVWQDAAGKWQDAPASIEPLNEDQGTILCALPKPTGTRIRALGVILYLRRLAKSEPFVFTVPIQAGIPPKLPHQK